jgi:hypothetical protein
MKKFILPLCLLAVIACSKKDDDNTSTKTTSTTTSGSTTPGFTKANLTGTWDYTKVQTLDMATDSVTDETLLEKGEAALIFGTDNSIIVMDQGDPVDQWMYSITKKNNKDFLALIRFGNENDTMEVASFTGTSMVLNEKLDAQSDSSDQYVKVYLKKR